MKAQIVGLEQASANSQDGISLVQTAEGALTEVHSMQNRMTERATKSANGTIQDNADRVSIQTEVDAIDKVSTNRGNLGALQNRLEYAIKNLDTTSENMDAANSRIRNTDMANEMLTYTKMNILSQTAQANQQPQNILQLLQ